MIVAILNLFFSTFLYALCPSPEEFQKLVHIKMIGPNGDSLYTFNDSPHLYAKELTDGKRFLEFQKMIQSKTDTSWKGLIEKQNLIFQNAGFNTDLAKKILKEEVGHVSPINCLTSIFFGIHLKMQNNNLYSEFMIDVFKNKKTVKVLFTSQDQASIQTTKEWKEEKEKLIKANWRHILSLHNHPFSFDNPYGDIGGSLVPSSADWAHFQKQLDEQLESAAITNGFHTIYL